MKVKVGIVGVDNVTVTLYLARGTADTTNMHKGNYQGVALAVARRTLDCTVFPIAIDEPEWLPDAPVKMPRQVDIAKGTADRYAKAVKHG